MKYLEIKIYTNPSNMDPLTYILENIGIAGFIVEDPQDLKELLEKKNAYDWDYVDESVMELSGIKPNITFYLNDDDAGILQLEEIRIALQENKFGDLELQVKKVCDDQWKDNWKEYFKPTKVTERLVVKPTWEVYEKKETTELVIAIDPGMAFGTGTHETTSLCMKLLEKYMQPKDRVLDVGCGSGILSIAASLLGASAVLGVDIDPEAVRVSKENVILNMPEMELAARQNSGMESPMIEICYGDLTKGIDFRADIVVANLMADLVVMLSSDVAKHLQGNAIYISSGILVEKKEMVSAAIVEAGFKIVEILVDGEWCAICATL